LKSQTQTNLKKAKILYNAFDSTVAHSMFKECIKYLLHVVFGDFLRFFLYLRKKKRKRRKEKKKTVYESCKRAFFFFFFV
jgi:hypothetical protein